MSNIPGYLETAKGLLKTGFSLYIKGAQSQQRSTQVIAKALLHLVEQETAHEAGLCVIHIDELASLGAHTLGRPCSLTAAEAKGVHEWARHTLLPAPIKSKDAVKDGISEERRRIHNQDVQRNAVALRSGLSFASILAFLKVDSSNFDEKKGCFVIHSDVFKKYGQLNPAHIGKSLVINGSEANNNLLIFLNPDKPTSPFFLQPTVTSITKFLRYKSVSDMVAKNYLAIIEQAVSALHPDEPVPNDQEMMEKISALALRCHEWIELRKAKKARQAPEREAMFAS